MNQSLLITYSFLEQPFAFLLCRPVLALRWRSFTLVFSLYSAVWLFVIFFSCTYNYTNIFFLPTSQHILGQVIETFEKHAGSHSFKGLDSNRLVKDHVRLSIYNRLLEPQETLTRGGSRGRVQGVCIPPSPRDNLRFSNTTGILQKETMWFIGVEVEEETSAPSPKKKNPGSAPANQPVMFVAGVPGFWIGMKSRWLLSPETNFLPKSSIYPFNTIRLFGLTSFVFNTSLNIISGLILTEIEKKKEIQFLSVFPTLPFQISHSVLEWSNSSIHRSLLSGEARNSLRSES